MDWIWYSQNHIANGLLANPPQFYLPFESDSVSVVTEEHERTKEMLTNHKICKSALGYLLNLKIKPWLQMKNGVANSIIHQHGLIGKTSNRQKEFNEQVKNNLDDYFLTLEMLASPTSTRFVREQTRILACVTTMMEGRWLSCHHIYLSENCIGAFVMNKDGR